MTQDITEERVVGLHSRLNAVAQIILDQIGADRQLDLIVFYASPDDLRKGLVDNTVFGAIENVTVESLANQFAHFAIFKPGRVPYGYVALMENGSGCITTACLMHSPFFSDCVRKTLENYVQSQYAIMTGTAL